MRFANSIAALLTVGLAAAHSRRATCAAQNILDACLATENPQLQACAANDWDCMCTQSNNVLTCYNNCPGDENQFGAQQTMTSYCNAAKAYGTSSSSSMISSATSMASASGKSSSTTTSTSTSTTSSASETSTGTSKGSSTLSHSSSSDSSSADSSSSSDSAAAPSIMIDGLTVQGGLVAALALGLGMVL